ncbi:MAG: GDYXXLXY domain-containing protein [Paenisporosarcina sp.]
MRKWIMPIVQSIFVIFLILSFYATSWVGEEYVLRAEPFDPFDPFYGEYVMLQYPDLKAPDYVQQGDIYFTLKQGDDGFAVIDRMENDSFFGAIRGTYYGQVAAPQLEQFYVEQGVGPELEKAGNLQATIFVAPWGSIRPMDLEKRETK